jgi:hypothetical protein
LSRLFNLKRDLHSFRKEHIIMFVQRFLPRSRGARFVAAATALALSLGGASAALDMRAAGAIGITHKLAGTTKQNFSLAPERPTITFTCNDATLAYKFKATNVQVIKRDHVTPWDTYELRIVVSHLTAPFDAFRVFDIPLTQNATNGLFTATSAGTLPAGFCATQIAVDITDDHDVSGYELHFSWTLT